MSETPHTEVDFERRFGGIARLYGRAALDRFCQSRVCVIGIGGVGSWVAEALARSGIGAMTLIDLDNVSESNVNRQIHALESQFGRPKVDVMAERIRGINAACRVTCVEAFVELDNPPQMLGTDFDFVIDCIDNFKVKAALIAHCRRNKIRLITVGGAGGQTDPLKIRLTDLSRTQHDPLLAKTRKLLRKQYHFPVNPKRRFDVPCVYSDEQPVYPAENGTVCSDKSIGLAGNGLHCGGYGSAMTVTTTFGMAAVAHVLKKLAG